MTDELANTSVLVAGNPFLVKVLGALLRGTGAEVHLASTAASARHLLSHHDVDLVIADVDLGESCAGFDLAMTLRMAAAAQHTRVVLTSDVPATCTLLSLVPVAWLPCDRFVARPAGGVALLQIVKELLEEQPAAAWRSGQTGAGTKVKGGLRVDGDGLSRSEWSKTAPPRGD